MSVCTTYAKKPKTVTLKFIQTADVHGMFFPINYMTGKTVGGSMARVSSYVKSQRAAFGNNVILLDNGDILQGQPTNYYWNFIDTQDENIAASVINYMKYDALAFGNHDVEPGHKCYDKWISELKCPILAANMVNAATGQPYTNAYKIIEREGVKIAILGMNTPAIPNWLSEDTWSGIRFEETVSCTRKWVKLIKEKEKPDLIIGLFHSGLKGGIETDEYDENATLAIAQRIHGLDVIFYAHDHQANYGFIRQYEEKTDEFPFYFITKDGNASSPFSLSKTDSVLIVNPGSNAQSVGEASITLTMENGKVASKKITGQLVSMKSMPIDEDYMDHFADEIRRLQAYTYQTIGYFATSINMSDAFFGSSAFIDFILNLQMKITGADISFAAPLLMKATINAGPVTTADMFNLYKFENKLYVIKMTGAEIKNYLEMSYALWTNQMKSSDDHLLLFDNERNNVLKNLFFNFDSAAGIDYTVDVTKPEGQKINILKMSNGQPFEADKWYKVAINSYRGSGGGELLTKGAGIAKDEIPSRIIYRSELDQRHYLTEEIRKQGTVNPKPNNNWRFIPENIVAPAIQRDRELLFNKK
jgi:2',3'-cyclic-nucleotide 2'-phosphodiesterase/3'-nucleotidase